MEIPDGVETIAPACFLGNEAIEGVSIPDSVTIIGEEAFMNCASLKNVHGAKNVKKIQEYIQNQLKEDKVHDQMTLREFEDPFTGSK